MKYVIIDEVRNIPDNILRLWREGTMSEGDHVEGDKVVQQHEQPDVATVPEGDTKPLNAEGEPTEAEEEAGSDDEE